MKVLILTRPKDNLVGGDFVQVENTLYWLRSLGCEVEVKDNCEGIGGFDIIHLFVFWTPLTARWIREIKKFNKPLICSMLYQ
jgi:hypothetical protein